MASAPPTNASLIFKVTRKCPEFIVPAKPTPKECKLLSDIDDQEGLRFQIPFIQFYRTNQTMKRTDPVEVIRDALTKALVFYYPLAGRLREGHGRKLMVDCTGEGILFIEADADVALEQFGQPLLPPFPCWDELLFDVPGSSGILHSPLLHIQVTRLTCGGFILALRLNHMISDFAGLNQFISAVSEIARGATSPLILPTWRRELLSARNTPRISCTHHEYDEIIPDTKAFIIPFDEIVKRNFFFGPNEISALKKSVGKNCSTFEVLTAFLWRSWSTALQLEPHKEVRVLSAVNARPVFNPPLPAGYYGNTFALPAAVATVEKLCSHPLSYALELVTKAKSSVTEEYMRSVADLTVIKGRPNFTIFGSLSISDVTRSEYDKIDFGWGQAVYGGPPVGSSVTDSSARCFFISYRNTKGERGILVPVSLPVLAMERLANEINCALYGNKVQEDITKKKFDVIKSTL